jgi:hypothetical protein
VEKEILVEKEAKVRDNRKTAHRLWRKMGRLIRVHAKPNTIQQSKLIHVEVLINNKMTWTKIEDKDKVEHHPIARNVEQFSHAGVQHLLDSQISAKSWDTRGTAPWRDRF